MQTLETGKQKINDLLAKYGPLGPRHLLAAALMQHARNEAAKSGTKGYEPKVDRKGEIKVA